MKRSHILALGLLSTVMMAQPAHRSVAAQTFVPAMTASDLNGRELKVPDDMLGAPALWVVAFDRAHQGQVDRLQKLALSVKLDSPGLAFWEIPLIEDPGSIARWFIDNGMRSGIPSKETRAKVVTLYVADRAAWLKLVGIAGTEQAYAVLLKRNGQVAGVASQAEIQTLAQMATFIAKAAKQ